MGLIEFFLTIIQNSNLLCQKFLNYTHVSMFFHMLRDLIEQISTKTEIIFKY